MSEKIFRARYDNSYITIEVPVTNPTEATLREVSLEFDTLESGLGIDSVDKKVGEWSGEDGIWDGFSLKPGETQVLYVKFSIDDIDNEGGFYVTASITNGYSGFDPSSQTIAFWIRQEDDEPISRTLKGIVSQSGTAAPSMVTLDNQFQVTPAWARTGEGVYTLTATSSWYSNLTMWTINQQGQPTAVKYTLERTSADVLTLRTFAANGDPDDLDGTLHITVEVFND